MPQIVNALFYILHNRAQMQKVFPNAHPASGVPLAHWFLQGHASLPCPMHPHNPSFFCIDLVSLLDFFVCLILTILVFFRLAAKSILWRHMKYILRVSLPNKLRAQIIQPRLMSSLLQMARFGITGLYRRDFYSCILAWNIKFQSAEPQRGITLPWILIQLHF